MKVEWEVELDASTTSRLGEMFGWNEAPHYQLTFWTKAAVPLRTGKRGSRTRAEHARILRVARLERRVARRQKRPVRTREVVTYIPRAALSASPS